MLWLWVSRQLFDAHCCHMVTAIKHRVPDRIKMSFVIFDIQALWPSALSVRVPGFKNYKCRLNPVWYTMLYSCNHMATVGVKGLRHQNQNNLNTTVEHDAHINDPMFFLIQHLISITILVFSNEKWKTKHRHRTYHFFAELAHSTAAVRTDDLGLTDHASVNDKPTVTARL